MIKIREATLADCGSLSKLKLSVWKTTYCGIYPKKKFDEYDFIANKNKFENLVNNPDVQLFVVCDDSEVIGYMSCGALMRPFENYKQEIGLLYVSKDYQKIGLGRKLFDLAVLCIKKNGYDTFIVSCNKYNLKAQNFYAKMGGKIVHTDEDNEDKSLPQVKFLYKVK